MRPNGSREEAKRPEQKNERRGEKMGVQYVNICLATKRKKIE